MASSNNKRDPRFWNKTNSHLFGDVSIEEESNYVFNVHKYNIGNHHVYLFLEVSLMPHLEVKPQASSCLVFS